MSKEFSCGSELPGSVVNGDSNMERPGPFLPGHEIKNRTIIFASTTHTILNF
jgi:hypothetical protein